MKLFGVVISSPRDDDRTFLVSAETEQQARWMALDHVDYELCSSRVVPGESILSERDGCAELVN